MIDLRYHVYSLAAVFFALAIGIVVGSSFVGKTGDKEQLQRVESRYERALDDLKDEVYRQRDDIRATRVSLRRSEDICASMLPIALKGRLVYHNVAIVVTGDYDKFIPQIKDALQSVGANVTSVTRVSELVDESKSDELETALSDAGIVSKSGETPTATVTRVLGDAIVTAGLPERLYELEDKRIVNLSGDYKRWNKHVVIVGGSSSKDAKRAEILDTPLIKRMLNQGAVVVACEPFSAKGSYIHEWKRLDIATVDNVDSPSGLVSLICALSGEVANFGVKSTADRQVPETVGGVRP